MTDFHSLPFMRAALERMVRDHPVTHWGRPLAIEVTARETAMCPDVMSARVLLFGVGHLHLDRHRFGVHFEDYYLAAIERGIPGTPDPVEVLADAWAQALKPFYRPSKRRYWRERMMSEARA